MMQLLPRNEILVVGGDMNGHVVKDRAEYEDVHGGRVM